MTKLLTVVIVFVSLLLASPVWAVTKYVTQSGTCTNGATTYSAATNTCGAGSATVYTSIRSGADAVGAGNILLIRGGTYSELCVNALIEGGTSLANTVIRPYPSENVIWNKTTGDSRDCLISFASAQAYITIDGWASDGTGSLIMDGQSSNVSADQAMLVGNSATNITIKNLELRDGYESCITGNYASLTLENNLIHDCGTSGSNLWHGIYFLGPNAIIRKNTFHTIPGYAVHCYSGTSLCSTNTIEDNKIYNVATATVAQTGGILVRGNGNIVRRNIIRCAAGTSDFGVYAYSTGSGNFFDHNSVTNCGTAAAVDSGVSGTTFRNNIFYGNVTTMSNAGSGTVQTTNLTVDPSWTNAATADLTLASGSAGIDACTDIGMSFNGSAPDCGAFETFTGSGGTVTGNTLDAQLGMAFHTPLIPGATGFTVNNGRSVTGITLVGSSIARLTFDGAACTGVQSWTWSYSGGTATDTAGVGSSVSGRLNQPLLTVGATSVTNNCSGTSYSFTQSDFRYHGVFSATEAAPSIRSTENAATFNTVTNGAVRIRFSLVCDAGVDCASSAFSLYYAQGGGYSVLPNTPGGGTVSFCGTTYTGDNTLTNPTPTTNQLSTAGTFRTGAVVFTSDSVPSVTLNATEKTEIEACVKFTSSATGSYTFRLYTQDGTALGTYTNTPSVTIIPMQANGGM